jgi:hypothetical protein
LSPAIFVGGRRGAHPGYGADARNSHHLSPISPFLDDMLGGREGGIRVMNQRADATADQQPQSSATTNKAVARPRKHWLDYATAFLTLAAAGGAITAAIFTGWQAVTADQGMRAGNRAYVHSTNFRFVHYGAKNENGRTQWSVAPLIENTGNTGTREMLITSIIGPAGGADFDSLEKAVFAPALILPKSEMTGAVVSMDGRGLDQLRGAGLIAMGVVKYADVFGAMHLVEFCQRAEFGPIDWEGVPAGQPLRIRGIACESHNCEDNECGADWQARATAMASRRPERSNMRREAGFVARPAQN